MTQAPLSSLAELLAEIEVLRGKLKEASAATKAFLRELNTPPQQDGKEEDEAAPTPQQQRDETNISWQNSGPGEATSEETRLEISTEKETIAPHPEQEGECDQLTIEMPLSAFGELADKVAAPSGDDEDYLGDPDKWLLDTKIIEDANEPCFASKAEERRYRLAKQLTDAPHPEQEGECGWTETGDPCRLLSAGIDCPKCGPVHNAAPLAASGGGDLVITVPDTCKSVGIAFKPSPAGLIERLRAMRTRTGAEAATLIEDQAAALDGMRLEAEIDKSFATDLAIRLRDAQSEISTLTKRVEELEAGLEWIEQAAINSRQHNFIADKARSLLRRERVRGE